MLCQALCIISKPSKNSNWSYSPEMLNSVQNWPFFVPCELGIWWMTLKNNRALLLCYFPANWRSRSASVCFTFVRNIVFQHKINFCVDVELIVRFTCVWLCVICVSFEFILGSCVFTLSLRCFRAHGELKMVSNQHIVNTKNPENTLEPICWVKLCVSFHSHQSIQTGVIVWKRPIRVKINDFFVPCDLEIW